MDSRFRFLHCSMTELWGRMERARAGRGKTGASAGGARQANPPCTTQRRDADRTQVGKRAGSVPRKAAIVHAAPVPQTDTGGWGEDPQAGGRSIVKELGKMSP